MSLAAAYDPKRKNSLKSEGRYLRSTTSDVRTVDKTALLVRDEYKLSDHSFVFAETRLFRDVLKGIRYLVSPLAGAGVKLVDRERAQLLLDGAVGGQFEKDDGRPRNSSGAFQAGQQLTLKLSSNASLSQRAYALWKMGDFADPLLEKNDASVVAALVFKIG